MIEMVGGLPQHCINGHAKLTAVAAFLLGMVGETTEYEPSHLLGADPQFYRLIESSSH